MLLTDAQVQSFIRSGLMEIALPDLEHVHYEVNSRLRELCELNLIMAITYYPGCLFFNEFFGTRKSMVL